MRNLTVNIIYSLCILLLIGGCSTKNDAILEKKILMPESVEIYDISVENIYTKIDRRDVLLKKFPFISHQAIFNFHGKFSNQFYDKLSYRYHTSALQDINFWELRKNPFLEDFIYVLPIWANKFKNISNNLFENIAYSYNLSHKEQEILTWWVKQGGILWIEGGIYSTRYDTFHQNGKIDTKKIDEKIMQKSTQLTFLNHPINAYIYKSKKIDFVNYTPLTLKFKTHSPLEYFKDIKNLKIETKNFLSADFIAQADNLLLDNKSKPLVSFITQGKGGIVFTRPFEFKDKRYDGELLRWKITYYLLNRMYLNKKITKINEPVIQTPNETSIAKELQKHKKIILNNLQFKLSSYILKKDGYKLLEPIATYLKNNPSVNLIISGYTDSVGARTYNNLLSKNRAKHVKEALVKMGINTQRLTARGYGSSFPIANNKTEAGRALNRRVEFTIAKK